MKNIIGKSILLLVITTILIILTIFLIKSFYVPKSEHDWFGFVLVLFVFFPVDAIITGIVGALLTKSFWISSLVFFISFAFVNFTISGHFIDSYTIGFLIYSLICLASSALVLKKKFFWY